VSEKDQLPHNPKKNGIERHSQCVICFKVSRSDTGHFCWLYLRSCFSVSLGL